MNSAVPQQPDDPAYLAALGLQRAPFLDQIDDRFFYADPALVQRLDLLQHLTRFGDMLLGVIGPAGSGKSTLLQQFMARGGTTWRCCRINAAQIGRPDELLARLCACFTPDASTDPERAKAGLQRQFQSLRLASQLPVILIDDAQLLPEPVLRGLLELGGTARETLKLVRVVLFAEPGLEQKLTQAGLHNPQQPLLHSLEVPGFDMQQAAAYLMYRLAVAGYSGDSPFSLTEIRALHKAAEGLPAKLNVLAHETLMERAGRIVARKSSAIAAAAAASASGSASRRKRLVALGGVLALALAGGLLLQSGILRVPAPGLPDLAETPQPDTPPPDPAESVSVAEATAPATDQAPEASPIQDTTPAAPETDEIAAEPEPAVTAVDAASHPDTETPAGPATANPPETASTTTPAVVAPAAAPPANAESEPAATPSEPAPEEPSAPAPQTSAAPPVTAAEPAPAATQAPSGSMTAAAPASVLREDWLKERPAARFTLQLLGVRSEASLRDYLGMHRPPGPVAYFRTEYKGAEWFVLVQGDYPSMAAARAAVAALPAAIRKAKPWPRSFASVHTDIEKGSTKN